MNLGRKAQDSESLYIYFVFVDKKIPDLLNNKRDIPSRLSLLNLYSIEMYTEWLHRSLLPLPLLYFRKSLEWMVEDGPNPNP